MLPVSGGSRPAFSSDDSQVLDWRLQQRLVSVGHQKDLQREASGQPHKPPAGHRGSPRSQIQIKSRSDSCSVMCPDMNQKYFMNPRGEIIARKQGSFSPQTANTQQPSTTFTAICAHLTFYNACLHRERKRSVQSEEEQRPCGCASCQDVLKDPVPTSCGHRLCKQCISSNWDQSACPGPGLQTSTVQGKTVNLLRSACLKIRHTPAANSKH